MKERDARFLSMVFPRYYGRLDSAKVDIKYA